MKFILFIFYLYLIFSYNKKLLVEKCQIIDHFKEFCFLKSQNKYNKNLSFEKYEKLLKSWYKKN
jgi:hypothetical protein